jgi:hypothetical protein
MNLVSVCTDLTLGNTRLADQFRRDPFTAQLYSMIPFAFGLVSLEGFAWLADRTGQKGMVTLGCMALTCAGMIVLLSTTNSIALVAGTCFVCAGAYPQLVVSVSWCLTFHGGYTKRAFATWLVMIQVRGRKTAN